MRLCGGEGSPTQTAHPGDESGQGGLPLYSCEMFWLCTPHVSRLPCVREPFRDKLARSDGAGIQMGCLLPWGHVWGRVVHRAGGQLHLRLHRWESRSTWVVAAHRQVPSRCRVAGWTRALQDGEEPAQAPGVLGHTGCCSAPHLQGALAPRKLPVLRTPLCTPHGQGPT